MKGTYQPLRCSTDLTRRDARNAVTSEIGGIDGCEEQILGIDGERLAAESQGNAGGRGARDGETALPVRCRSGNSRMDCGSISGRGNDEGGAGVEDGSAALKPEVLTVDGEGHGALPETFRVDVVERDQRGRVEFRVIKATEGDLAIVQVVLETGNLVRGDGIGDQAGCSKGLDGGQRLLLGERLKLMDLSEQEGRKEN